MKRWTAALPAAALLLSMPIHAARAGILPQGVDYDPAVPAPSSMLGFEIGEWHVRHDQLVHYLEALAASSERVAIEVQGYTHERRPQLLLTVTSPVNHARLGEIRERRAALTDPSLPRPTEAELDRLPAVVLLGYSIHGDEPSGANAALAVAYHLAAARDPEVERWLSELVVLIDPSLNPDGLGRFAHWVNVHKGTRLVADPAHREHVQGWPRGRTNHYWFDLNRDWLLLQQPESRARVDTFQRWHPNLLGDYHEMGANATYFFQPGVPSRQNPLTPAANFELTAKIARFHAAALDPDGRAYYTEETFDDFYPGKGSTYPDLNGSVGVLFEQAGADGHLRETERGLLSFAFGIENQFRTSLSMLAGATAHRRELLAYQADFFRSALDEAARFPVAGYLFATPGDPVRAHRLIEILRRHRIEVRSLAAPLTVDGRAFEPGTAFVVPTRQPQHRLVRTLFETRTEFEDSTFYDISTWTLPLAFGARTAELGAARMRGPEIGPPVGKPAFPARTAPAGEGAYAYLLDWSGYLAPRSLYRLLDAGFAVNVATEPFDATVASGGEPRRFAAGTLVVPVTPGDRVTTDQPSGREAELADLLATIAEDDGVAIHAAATGLTPAGPDLGSNTVEPLRLPEILLVAGEGTSMYEVGEAWHLLDYRFGMRVSLVDLDRLARTDLDRYTHVVMVDGRYDDVSDALAEALATWVREGGTLIASKGAAGWAGKTVLALGPKEEANGAVDPDAGSERVAYGEYPRLRATQLVNGAIVEAIVDLTHPIGFGLADERLPIFRNATEVLAPSPNPYENPIHYADEPLVSGYMSEKRWQEIAGTTAATVSRLGQGTVVRLADNPSFRAFWYGTTKLFMNALFFGPVVRPTQAPDQW